MTLISVKDQLPEFDTEVLFLRDEDNYFVGRLENWLDGVVFIESRECMPFYDVTHWAELPKLPRKD